MNNDKKYFHFTLGPVQGFVAQARRTRDFWAGSFLLSWLAGVAIQAVKVQGGQVKFPIPDDNFLQAIATGQATTLPRQGGIPNRFMADITECSDFSGQAVVGAVKTAWQAVADSVWEHDRQGLEQADYPTKTIWERQNAKFWDMTWVITQGTDTSALDKRKNFRTHMASVESGYKCMMMEGYQELSGASDKNSGDKRRAYWTSLKYHADIGLDLRDGEELCAIAYIKRRFVHIFNKVKQSIDVNGKSIMVHGWQLPHNVPSVAYMAGVPWLKKVIKADDEGSKLFDEFLLSIDEITRQTSYRLPKSESKNHVYSIQQSVDKKTLKELSLDGNIYFSTHWENLNNLVGDKNNYDGRIDEYLPKIKRSLRAVYESLGEPSPYYAILLMDGDSLGKQMSESERQPIISHALNDFTKQAQQVVKEHDGFLVYAGGDDVLALFSLDDAMRAGVALQQCYKDCFGNASEKHGKGKGDNGSDVVVHSTLSGAINYCHIGTPLTHVLMDSHDLLDNIAKDGTGRNALAVRVHKPSGQAVQWSLPWDKVLDKDSLQTLNKQFGFDDENTPVIEALARAMSGQKLTNETINEQKLIDETMSEQKSADKVSPFSTGFFYKTRHLMGMLNEMMLKNELNADDATSLLLAEYMQSGNLRKIKEDKQKKLLSIFKVLIEQSKDYRSKIDDGKATIDDKSGKKLTGDAGILLRILGQKGLGKGDKS
ncbi:MAG: type III-B CRISPR-associated protein Cas10/Cmr2 [Moraxella sp.]|nr:type III-B CRISPR-associated protein Cas10/Cmr2 [Moraxella sp.]